VKRIVTGILPVLLLVLALTFMTNYKSVEDLTDMEEYEINNFVESTETASASEKQPERNLANASVENGNDVDPNKTYAITSDEHNVTVYDNEGNAVFETSITDWEDNREAYYQKYRLGS